jgi:hypothetical protein
MSDHNCAVCGTPAPAPFRASQPEIAPDLDMRPGEPVRSTLRDWIQTCTQCGAAAPDLAALPKTAKATVESERYRNLTTVALEETLPFRRYALICEQAGDPEQQAEGLLQAAWAADDVAAMTEAAKLRSDVAALWDGTGDPERAIRRLDVLRRAGQFDVATVWAGMLLQRDQDDLASKIIQFQQSRIAARDVGRHLISAALPPPSHTPHVARSKRTSTGFWSRLLRS